MESKNVLPPRIIQLLSLEIFLAAPLSLFSGLGLAPLFIIIALPLAAIAIQDRNLRAFFTPHFITLDTLFTLGLISAIWSIHWMESLDMWWRLALLEIFGFTSLVYISNLEPQDRQRLGCMLYKGVYLALVLVLVELFTDGMITRFIRQEDVFQAHHLNRGACFLVLLAWPCIYYLVRYYCNPKLKIAMAAGLWAITLLLLLQLESLSAIVGYIAASITFLFVYVFKGKLNLVIIVSTALVILLTPIIVSQMQPKQISEDYPGLPASAEHRLHIWHFVSAKAGERKWLGWGLNSSDHIPGGTQTIDKDGRQELLPTHPHNHTLQIWLELGIIGVLFFAAFVVSVLHRIHTSDMDLLAKSVSFSAAIGYFIIGAAAYGVWQAWWIAAGFLVAVCIKVVVQAPVKAS